MPQAIPYFAYAISGSQAVAFVAMVAVADYQATQAKERARTAQREASRNRAFNVRTGIAPRKVVLGTMRVGGVVAYADLVGDEQQYVDQVVSLNHGQADVLGVYMDDTFIPAAAFVDHVPIGGSTGEKSLIYTTTLSTAATTVRLPYTPNHPAAVTAKHMPDGTPITVSSVTGKTVTLAGPYTGIIEIHYTTVEDPADKYSGAAAIEQSMEYAVELSTPTATITLPLTPADPAKVSAVASSTSTSGGTGESSDARPLTVASVVGNVVTLSAPETGRVEVHYTSTANPTVPLRVQWTSGSATQGPTSWAGVDTPLWTADHLQLGVLYLRTLMLTDANVFQQGLPNPSALLRGNMPVWDPRSSTWVTGTSNPALLAAWYGTLPRVDGGYGAPSDMVDWASVGEAANICDEMISVRKMDGSGYESIKRYECHTVLTLADAAPEDNMRIITSAMAGEWVFTAGQFKVFAGAFRAATVTITDDDVDGESPIVFAPLLSADEQPANTVTSRIYSAAANWMETAPRQVQNSSYVTADGGEVPDELELPATTDERQANYLMGVHLERMRPALGGQVTLLGRGANVALLDTVQFALTGYEDLAGRTFEVRRRTNAWNGKYPLELREVRASTWALDADRFTAAAGSGISTDPGLWNVDPVVITDVANAAQVQPDGSVVARALVQWAAHGQVWVNPRGYIELRYKVAGGVDWTYAPPARGDQVAAFVGPLSVGTVLWVEARARNALGAVSAWSSFAPLPVTGTNDVPPDVAALSYEIKPGQVWLRWTPWADPSYQWTELRVGASWAAGTLLATPSGSDYQHPRPADGTYTVWAAHRNRSGHYSATPQSVAVTVDASIDPGASSAQLLQLQADGFAFVFGDVNATTSSSPTISLTAQLTNITGTATFVATAYNAAGGSLGTVTLGGSGNTRTLTAAQFNALGATTTRYVKVVATLGTLSDTVTIYRGDGGSSAIQAVLGNEAVTLPADNAGTVSSYAGAGTTIRVFEGATELTYNGVGTTAGTYAVSAAGSSITPGSLMGTYPYCTASTPSSMVADSASITFTISGRMLSGAAFTTFAKVQSFAKSRAGANGTPGSNGSNGTNGASAVYAYQTVAGASLPAAPAVGSGAPTSGNAPASSADGVWYTNPPSGVLASGYWLFQKSGTVSGGTYTWVSPSYLATFIVGDLAALSAKINGALSQAIPGFGTLGCALLVNSSNVQAVGLYSSSTSFYGVVGYSSGTFGVGVVGIGAGGGVRGVAKASGYFGVSGYGDASLGGHGMYATPGHTSSGGMGIQAVASATGQIAVKAESTDGKAIVASSTNSTGLEVSSGTGLSINATAGLARMQAGLSVGVSFEFAFSASTGSATATFTSTNKPGSNSANQWIAVKVNGVSGRIPWWPD